LFYSKEGASQEVILKERLKMQARLKTFNKTWMREAIAAKDENVTILTLKNETVVGWNDKKFALNNI